MESSQQVDVETDHSATGYTLKLPGKQLNLSALLYFTPKGFGHMDTRIQGWRFSCFSGTTVR